LVNVCSSLKIFAVPVVTPVTLPVRPLKLSTYFVTPAVLLTVMIFPLGTRLIPEPADKVIPPVRPLKLSTYFVSPEDAILLTVMIFH